jgi:DNA repair exonuclease SbcCD ATPase subunit
MLNFGVLTGKNIMSFGSGGFEIDLSENQISMMRGKSGNGKSTILEALTYCLFGKPYRNIKLAQLINSINGKGMLTTISFTSNQDTFKVIRGMKPAIFEIYKNGEMIPEEAASRDYQKFLEESILGFGYKTFKQVCVIGSTAYTQFMSLSSSERRNMIEELLDIAVFSRMDLKVKELLKKMKKDVDLISTLVDAKNSELGRLNKILSEMQESESRKKTEFKDQIDSLEKEKTEINSRIDQYNKIVSQLIEKTADESKIRKSHLDSQNELRGYLDTISRSKSTMKFFESNDMCSTCNQEITADHKHSIVSKEKQIVSDTMKLSKEIYSTIEEFNKKIEEFDSFADALHKATNKLLELQSDLRAKESLLTNVNRELNRENDSDKVIKQSNQVSDELRTNMVQKIILLEDLDYINVCATILKDTGIKSKIISTFIPMINDRINHYLESFDLFVNFELDENFSETIKSRHRDAFTYDSFSEGEKARIDTAILFTWRDIARRKNSVSTNLLIFDETCDRSLDDDSIQSFLEILREQDGTNTLIITHRGADPVYFDRCYHVDKRSDGFSRLEDLS